jgi:hypothetical protein
VAINNMQRAKFFYKHPPDECLALAFDGITVLWKSVVCSRNEYNEWYKLICLMVDCNSCGIVIVVELITCHFVSLKDIDVSQY